MLKSDRTNQEKVADRRERLVLEIVDRALELSAAEQAIFLDQACADDTKLRQTVVQMLRQGATRDGVLEAGSPLRGPLVTELTGPTAVDGDRFGPFRVLGELGRGGMGVVYLAERADGHFEQQVALKLLPAGGDRDLARRLEDERRILATLEHPGIARLLDGGVTADGRPYFAMEYVEGLPIDRYCEEQTLELTARLQLFRAVCDAVESAHRQLVVHRDLKPSNILVTADGQVKLLDFGIARLVSPDLTQQTPTIALTLGYASPEQFRGEAVTVATDVYQLGVLLFELLTGRRPFDDVGSSWIAQIRAVLDREPPSPSSLLQQLGRSASARQVAGDLDHIVLQALSSEPSARYASVDRLRQDVGAYLAGLPVQARHGGTGYRVGKFVRRRRWAVAAAGGAICLFAALIVFYTWRLAGERDRAREAQQIAENERNATQQARQEAEEVVGFLSEVFSSSDPVLNQGVIPTTRELLDRGARRVEQDLAGRPRVQARLIKIIGDVYAQLGLYSQAEELLLESLQRHQQAGEEGGVGLVESHISLGKLRSWQGQIDDAEKHFRQALAHPDVVHGTLEIDALHGLSGVLKEQMRNEEAIQLYRRVIELKKARGEEGAALAIPINNLAIVFSQMGRVEETERLYREALKLLEGGEDPNMLAGTVANMGMLLADQGRRAEAEPLFRRGIEMKSKILGQDHPEVASLQCSLAALLVHLDKLDEATQLFREAIPILATKAPGHRSHSFALNNFGNLLLAQENFSEARLQYQKAVNLLTDYGGPEHPSLAFPFANLGEVLVELGELKQAQSYLQRSIQLLETSVGKEGLHVSWPVFHLGRVNRALGNHVQAEALFRRALKIRRAQLVEGAEEIAEVEAELAQLSPDR